MVNCSNMISFDVKFAVRPWKTPLMLRNGFLYFITLGFGTFGKLSYYRLNRLNRGNVSHCNDAINFHRFRERIFDLNVFKGAHLWILVKSKWYLLFKLTSWCDYLRWLMLYIHLFNTYHSHWRLKPKTRLIWKDLWTLTSSLFHFSLFHCRTDGL